MNSKNALTCNADLVAGLYYRISDDREGRELGVDRQDKDCTQIAKFEGAKVYDRYKDNDISASEKGRKDRPQYNRLIADAKAGKINMIIAYTSGRLTRRPREHEDLIDLARQCGITFKYVRSPSFDLNTAQGRKIARTLAAQDAGEAEEISERVKAAVVQRAERQEPHGGPRPFGVTADGLQLVEPEAKAVREWLTHVSAGGSLHAIVRKLDAAGEVTPPRIVTRHHKVDNKTVATKVDIGGKPWRAFNIRRILLNPRNVGFRMLDGKRYPTAHPAIIEDEAIWTAVVKILSNPNRALTHSTARKHLGTGLFLCTRCDDLPVNTAYNGTGGLIYKCLRCYRSWLAEPITKFVVKFVEGLLEDENERLRMLPDPVDQTDARQRELRNEEDDIKTKLRILVDQFSLAKPSSASAMALSVGLEVAESRLAEIADELALAGRASILEDLLRAPDPVQYWRNIDDLVLRQETIRGLMTVRLGAPIKGRAEWVASKFISIDPPAGSR